MNKRSYDVFGLNAKDIDEAKVLVEGALGISFDAHESSYRSGAYYRAGKAGGERFILQRNYDELDDEWAEPAHEEVAYVLYVNETYRAADIERLLSASVKDIQLLRRQEL